MSVNGRAGAKFEADLAAYAQTHGHPDCERRVIIAGWVVMVLR